MTVEPSGMGAQERLALRTQSENGCLQPGRGFSPEPNRADTLISGFQPPELREISFYVQKPPVCATVLQQPQLTKASSKKYRPTNVYTGLWPNNGVPQPSRADA